MVMQKKIACSEFEDLAILYALGELDDARRAAVDEHTRECAACAAVLQSEAQLQIALAAHEEAGESLDRSGFLLAQCRSELAEALDDVQGAGKHGLLER